MFPEGPSLPPTSQEADLTKLNMLLYILTLPGWLLWLQPIAMPLCMGFRLQLQPLPPGSPFAILLWT